MIEFTLPSLGADMDEGRLLEWKVAPGQAVRRGTIVAVVDTAKAAVEIESWHEGTVFELLAAPGDKIPVGTVIATLLTAGEDPATAPRRARAAPAAAGPAAPPAPGPAPTPAPAAFAAQAALRKPASPAARKRARELDVDIEQVAGSGPHGAVTIEDVERAAAQRAAPPDRGAGMRRAIGIAMARSKREIPHYYLAEPVPMRKATEWLARRNASRPVTERVLMGALQLKAVALALRDFPQLNGFWRSDPAAPAGGFVAGPGIHIGVAIAIRQGGLIAPALHDVDRLAVPDLMAALTDLVRRARAGSLRSSELSDPTVTVTNLGEQGVESVFGVIYPPQVALVGFGRIAERPWAEDGALRVAPLVTATLAGDHRVTDGHTGARFLAALRERLQRPEEL